MDGRGSDFDDFSILFMKMQKELYSRICYRHPHKLFCGVFSSCMSEEYMDSWDVIFFYDQKLRCLGDYGHGVIKV